MSTDATPAYRGYRLQALYTLFRILDSSSELRLVFHPEGNEDLSIYDESLSSQEVIQIKAYSTPLQLSDFKPSKELSFFNRITTEIKLNAGLKVKICSFGEFGPELLGALTDNVTHRNSVARKLSKHGFINETDARSMLSKVEPEQTNEKDLIEKVFSHLRQMMTGVDPDRAFEMLNFWLYICAEQKKAITRDELIEKINSVGRFLSERAAYHTEWHNVIVPIEDTEVDEQRQVELSNEFYQGVSTRYEHILANLDIPRNEKLERISELLERVRVVIVHGASGQGKTTLAYRFLKNYLPNDWRFRIRNVENKKHALSIATAITGHANAMDIPLVVYLDVSPSDNDWVELVKQLSTHPNIRVLVTVREEDWRKASVTGYEFTFEDIDLNLTQAEAEGLYHSFVQKAGGSSFLDFGDAWQRFGGEGPLLEFVYLITQGTTLRERLQHQIIRLGQEVESKSINPSTLHALFLVAIASAYESRTDVKALVKHLKISIPGPVFHRLEQEYLIRVTDQTMLAHGLHPIRSEILVDILSDTLFLSWGDAAQSCLPLIFEEDVEGFLMYAFSRRYEETTQLLEFISSYNPQRWIAYAGVVRALIWLGLVRYIEENDTFLNDAYTKLKGGLFSVVDFDITNVIEGVSDNFLNLLKGQIPESGFEELRKLKSRQTDKKSAFQLAKGWLATREAHPESPKSENDWIGASYCGFWLGRLAPNSRLATLFTTELLDQALRESSLETLSYLTLGTFSVQPNTLTMWVEDNYRLLVDKYCDETFTLHLKDNESTITSHFILDYESFPPLKQVTARANLDRENFVHDETMSRLHLLRRLFPYRKKYSTKGYGHRVTNLSGQVDDSIKNIDPCYLGNEWLVTVNATFRRLIEKKFRTETWREYVDEVLKIRKSIITLSLDLENALQEYFKRKEFNNPFQWLNVSQFDELKASLNKTPTLPLVAVDEWGLSEDIPVKKNEKSLDNQKKTSLANKKYAPYQNYVREYTNSFSTFINQGVDVLAINANIGRGRDILEVRRNATAQGINTDLEHSSVTKLAEACTALPNLQNEFRKLFGHLVDQHTLQSLEHQEKRILTRLAPLWYFFAYHPQKVSRNASEEFGNLFSRTRSNFTKQLRKELSLFSNETRKLSILEKEVLYKGERAICISVDHKGIPADLETILLTYKAINNALSQVNDKSLQEFVLDIHWRYAVVVPLLDGRKVNNSVWEIYLLSQLLEKKRPEEYSYPSAASLYPIEVTDDWMEKIGISIWSHPRVEVVFEMTKEIGSIIGLLNHLIDVLSLPEIDQDRDGVLQRYLEKLVRLLQEAFEKVVSTLGIVSSVIEEDMNRTPFPSRLSIIMDLTDRLLHTLQQTEEVSLEIESLKTWLLSMEEAFGLSGELASHWIFYVMHDVLKK